MCDVVVRWHESRVVSLLSHLYTVKSPASVFKHVYSSIVEREQNFGDGFFELMELMVV